MNSKRLPLDAIRRIVVEAIEVSIDAPERPTKGSTYVRATTIARLRAALEAAGIDWRTANRQQREADRLARKQRIIDEQARRAEADRRFGQPHFGHDEHPSDCRLYPGHVGPCAPRKS